MRARILALLLTAVATAGSGCGTQRPSGAAFVARANHLCGVLHHGHGEPGVVLGELSQLVRANKKLAVVRRLESNAAERRKLQGAYQGAYKELFEHPRDLRALARYEAVYKRKLRLYGGERALGLRACAQRPEDPIEVMRDGPPSRIRPPKPAP